MHIKHLKRPFEIESFFTNFKKETFNELGNSFLSLVLYMSLHELYLKVFFSNRIYSFQCESDFENLNILVKKTLSAYLHFKKL